VMRRTFVLRLHMVSSAGAFDVSVKARYHSEFSSQRARKDGVEGANNAIFKISTRV
jgi:hypothetical protein